MPLKKGSSKKVVSENVREMMDAGHPKEQAVAASMQNARKYANKVLKKYSKGGEVPEESPVSRLSKMLPSGDMMDKYGRGDLMSKLGKQDVIKSPGSELMKRYGGDDLTKKYMPFYKGGEVDPDSKFVVDDNSAKAILRTQMPSAGMDDDGENYSMQHLYEGGMVQLGDDVGEEEVLVDSEEPMDYNSEMRPVQKYNKGGQVNSKMAMALKKKQRGY